MPSSFVNHIDVPTFELVDARQSTALDVQRAARRSRVRKSRMRKLSASLGGAALLREVRALRSTMEDADRNEIAAEIENVRTVLRNIAREL